MRPPTTTTETTTTTAGGAVVRPPTTTRTTMRQGYEKMTRDQAEQLDWEAFRYITEEMTSVEIEAFEQRLATDQAAREAVAEAVELTQAIASCEHDSVSVATRERTPTRAARLAWMTLGALACLMLITAVQTWKPNGNAPIDPPSAASNQLAELWSKARDESQEDDWQAGWFTESEDTTSLDSAKEHEDVTAAPSWMLAAVSSQTVDMDDMNGDLDVPAPVGEKSLE
jgi:hypothetical protein